MSIKKKIEKDNKDSQSILQTDVGDLFSKVKSYVADVGERPIGLDTDLVALFAVESTLSEPVPETLEVEVGQIVHTYAVKVQAGKEKLANDKGARDAFAKLKPKMVTRFFANLTQGIYQFDWIRSGGEGLSCESNPAGGFVLQEQGQEAASCGQTEELRAEFFAIMNLRTSTPPSSPPTEAAPSSPPAKVKPLRQLTLPMKKDPKSQVYVPTVSLKKGATLFGGSFVVQAARKEKRRVIVICQNEIGEEVRLLGKVEKTAEGANLVLTEVTPTT